MPVSDTSMNKIWKLTYLVIYVYIYIYKKYTLQSCASTVVGIGTQSINWNYKLKSLTQQSHWLSAADDRCNKNWYILTTLYDNSIFFYVRVWYTRLYIMYNTQSPKHVTLGSNFGPGRKQVVALNVWYPRARHRVSEAAGLSRFSGCRGRTETDTTFIRVPDLRRGCRHIVIITILLHDVGRNDNNEMHVRSRKRVKKNEKQARGRLTTRVYAINANFRAAVIQSSAAASSCSSCCTHVPVAITHSHSRAYRPRVL